MERDANHRTIPLQFLCVVNTRDSAAPGSPPVTLTTPSQGTGCQTRKSDSTSFAVTLRSAVAARRSFDGVAAVLTRHAVQVKLAPPFELQFRMKLQNPDESKA